MANVIRRIMHGGVILSKLYDRTDGKPNALYGQEMEQISSDMAAYLLAAIPNSGVTVRNNVAMGGMVVEFDDGK